MTARSTSDWSGGARGLRAARMSPLEHLRVREQRSDRIMLTLFYGVLSTMFFEGVVRWGLGLAHLGSLIYLRDVVAVGSVGYLLLRPLLVYGWIERHIAIPSFLLILHFFVSIWMGCGLIAALFELKVFVYVVYGCAMWEIFRRHYDEIKTMFAIIFVVSTIALIVNFAVGKMPWEGQVYNTFFGSAESTKVWAAGTMQRLPGLTRDSTTAATVMCVTGFTVMLDVRSLWLKILITVLGSVAIYATTTKTLILVYPVICMWLFFGSEAFQFRAGKLVLVAFFVFCIVLPVLSGIFDFNTWSIYNNTPKLLSSFWDRLATAWPTIWDSFDNNLQYVLGEGLGSIGTAQLFSNDVIHWSVGDNLAIYLYVNFGLLGLAYLAFPGFKLLTQAAASGEKSINIQLWMMGIVMLTYGYGMTSSIVEEQIFSVLIGVVLGGTLHRNRTTYLPHAKVLRPTLESAQTP